MQDVQPSYLTCILGLIGLRLAGAHTHTFQQGLLLLISEVCSWAHSNLADSWLEILQYVFADLPAVQALLFKDQNDKILQEGMMSLYNLIFLMLTFLALALASIVNILHLPSNLSTTDIAAPYVTYWLQSIISKTEEFENMVSINMIQSCMPYSNKCRSSQQQCGFHS
jgi:hypothetical protein